jgi:hypothetical protein
LCQYFCDERRQTKTISLYNADQILHLTEVGGYSSKLNILGLLGGVVCVKNRAHAKRLTHEIKSRCHERERQNSGGRELYIATDKKMRNMLIVAQRSRSREVAHVLHFAFLVDLINCCSSPHMGQTYIFARQTIRIECVEAIVCLLATTKIRQRQQR